MGRAVLLSNNPVNIQIRYKGAAIKHEKWHPGHVIFFTGASIAAEDNRTLTFTLAIHMMEFKRPRAPLPLYRVGRGRFGNQPLARRSRGH